MAAGYIFHNPHLLLLLFLLVGSHYSNVQSNCDVCRNLQWVSVLAVAFGGKCEICADTACPDSIFSTMNVLFYCQRDGIADKNLILVHLLVYETLMKLLCATFTNSGGHLVQSQFKHFVIYGSTLEFDII